MIIKDYSSSNTTKTAGCLSAIYLYDHKRSSRNNLKKMPSRILLELCMISMSTKWARYGFFRHYSRFAVGRCRTTFVPRSSVVDDSYRYSGLAPISRAKSVAQKKKKAVAIDISAPTTEAIPPKTSSVGTQVSKPISKRTCSSSPENLL